MNQTSKCTSDASHEAMNRVTKIVNAIHSIHEWIARVREETCTITQIREHMHQLQADATRSVTQVEAMPNATV
jgi:hypothetical protein